ncbi:MAG: DUF58 domain-containing protein [Erythrobacter sp.]|uniref:DUF58 domain-containing protein n=1 Tax=Erythrobacter sp. TaxID=1042 RepID=UPI002611C230|nr:DUF58 domain-containing protein [Erythrobacter sp.]MDJ0979268.1 DUF58 domain-containing protein [Erythrobacter sp.]
MSRLSFLLGKIPPLPVVPTQRAAWIIAAFAPLALVIGAVSPGLWIIAPVAAVGLIALILIDAMIAGKALSWEVDCPVDTEVGQATTISLSARFRAGRVYSAKAALALDPRIAPGGRAAFDLAEEPQDAGYLGSATLFPERRGTADLSKAWLRWTGPLGLGARQVTLTLDKAVRIWPDLSPVRSKELQTILRDAQTGLIARRIRGEGTQFEALSEYESGMDRRRIDWKASARHNHLYARENESERNNQIVFAFDCGQAMCEPVDGMPRIDRAVSAALACAYVALKGGDRVALFGFAQRPQIMTPFISDSRAFNRLQGAAAGLDYTAAEPNFTLALATLTAKLQRRSLIVLFSDFTDSTAAELMIESLGRLVEKHLVLFVTIADSELEGFMDEEPGDIATLARSVTAETLSHQRRLVLQRLRQMGVDVIEAPWRKIGFDLIDRYFLIKNSEAIG